MRLRHRTCLVISYPTSADGAAPEVQNKEAQKGQKRECSGNELLRFAQENVDVIENGEEDLAAGDKFHSQSYCIVRNADFETFDRVTGYTDTGIAQHRHNTGAGPRDFEEQPKYEGRTFVARFRVNDSYADTGSLVWLAPDPPHDTRPKPSEAELKKLGISAFAYCKESLAEAR
ncbi:hypothetical protein B0H14DRAFT_2605482 [Mycena olivaceomarginata]|nr:hypothetical protein B0H14DRAFT_2605482 [Mycena olivaceomarginata]